MKSGHKSLFQRAASGRIVGCGTDGLRNATAQQHADFWYEYQVALDVSADQIKQTPSVTVGYTRQEAVWMPLMPNVANEEGKLIPCTENAQSESCKKFVGTGTGEQDTYSVLATLEQTFRAARRPIPPVQLVQARPAG